MKKKFKSLDDNELNISGGNETLNTLEKFGKKVMTAALFGALFISGARVQQKWDVYGKSKNLTKKILS